MKLAHITAVLIARNREFLRDRSSLSWNIIFPVLMVIGFAIMFSGDKPNLYKVGVYGHSEPMKQGFFATDYIEFIPVAVLPSAVTKIERHQLDMLFDLDLKRYWINDSSPKGYMLEKVLAGTDQGPFKRATVSGAEVRYIDWVIPGLLATNMMFSAMFGVGYVIVRYRKAGVLRRLKATPLKPLEFLSAQVLSRLLLIVGIVVLLYVGADSIVAISMYGSYLNLLIVYIFGAISLISLGLLMAARTASQELAGGLLNIVTWPMMFMSEAWFSLEGSPQWVHHIAQIFPLRHLIAGARAIMIDGAGLADIAGYLLTLAVMTLVFLSLGAWLFRWE